MNKCEEDSFIPSNQEEFTDVSAFRKKKAGKKRANLMKIGTGRTAPNSFASPGMAKLFVSLPYPGSKYPLKDMNARIERLLNGAQFKVKKRVSSKGATSPFEIYGEAHLLESALFEEDRWEKGTFLQLIKKNVRLPLDYDLPDDMSEQDVINKIEELKTTAAKACKERKSRGLMPH